MKVPSVALDAGVALHRRLAALFGWRTHGVQVMVTNAAEELLLIRHRYGNVDEWVLPGGGVRRHETFAAAAVREVREETAIILEGAALFGLYVSGIEGRLNTTRLFVGHGSGVPRADGFEIAEARFFALDDLPRPLSPATRRRLEEVSGGCMPDRRW